MRDHNILSMGFCLLLAFVGGIHIAEQIGPASDGLAIRSSNTQVLAEVTGKEIERPTRRTGARTESVSVNGTRVRSVRTYFNSYHLNVSYMRDGELRTALAPVGYDMFHETPTGARLEVSVSDAAPSFADAIPSGTLLYAAKHVGIGLLIVFVGAAALLLPIGGSDNTRRGESL
ncbi:MAG: hypothetical protein AAGH73_06585 [Pseudomonadota bacterium]